MQQPDTRAWVDIDLGALQRNAAALRKHAGIPMLPMVKADAYGLGAERVTAALEKTNPWGYGVATVNEGKELRRFGIARSVLVFTPLLDSELEQAHDANLTPVLGSERELRAWSKFGAAWHLAIDTGMNRAGLNWRDAMDPANPVIRAVKGESDIKISKPDGVATHFHSAELDDGSREEQEARFNQVLGRFGFKPKLLHTDNSAAIARRGPASASFARPGVFLYGVGSGPSAAIQPEPVVTLAGRVIETRTIEPGDTVSYDATFRAKRKSRIATIAVGYADGYPRTLSNVGTASVRGRLVAIAGTVTMDMIMLDVTDAKCEVGDVAVLIGRDGPNLLTVESVADAGGISPYALLTGLRSRIERRYVGGDSK